MRLLRAAYSRPPDRSRGFYAGRPWAAISRAPGTFFDRRCRAGREVKTPRRRPSGRDIRGAAAGRGSAEKCGRRRTASGKTKSEGRRRRGRAMSYERPRRLITSAGSLTNGSHRGSRINVHLFARSRCQLSATEYRAFGGHVRNVLLIALLTEGGEIFRTLCTRLLE